MSKILMSVTIDTECDKSLDWSNSNPMSFSSIIYGIPSILQPIFKKFSIRPTYFLSPEVIDNNECVDVLNNIANECELGTHLHADYIDPERTFINFDGKETHAFQTDFSNEIEFQKLQNLTQNFTSAFNFSPKVFRAGRYAANSNTIRSLSELGYKVDSSFTPHIKWESPIGSLIDHQDSPEQPYFCHHSNIYKEGNSSLLEIPVTIIKGTKFFIMEKHLWLRPKFSSLKEIKKIIKYMKSTYAENEFIVLNMMFHSQEIIPNASPYTKTEEEVATYINFLETVFEIAKEENIDFLTLEEIYEAFRASPSRP